MKQTFDLMAALFEQAKLYEECVGERARHITVSPRSYRRLLELMNSEQGDLSEKLSFDQDPELRTEFGEFLITIDESMVDTELMLH